MRTLVIATATIGAIAATSLLACDGSSIGAEQAASTECHDAKPDEAGKCRYGDGKYAPAVCCPVNDRPASPAGNS